MSVVTNQGSLTEVHDGRNLGMGVLEGMLQVRIHAFKSCHKEEEKDSWGMSVLTSFPDHEYEGDLGMGHSRSCSVHAGYVPRCTTQGKTTSD